jgi:hypothetical protein
MWNFALPMLVVVGIICFVVFYVWPKVKNSKWGEKKFDEMASPGRDIETTPQFIENIKNAKDGLKQKSVEAVKTIKDATAESKIIDKALGKDKKE